MKKFELTYIRLTLVLLAGFILCFNVQSQDLEPRFLSNMPTKANIVFASYAYSKGNIMLDNSLPIEDLNSSLNSFVFGYVRSFKLFNKLTKFDVIVPSTFGTFTGVVEEEDASTSRSGFGDPTFRLSMILLGAKALNTSEFFSQEQKKFKMGAVVRLRVPMGQYDPEKLINLGTNRYSLKLGLAGSYTFRKKLTWEMHLNSWYFAKNNAFYNGNTLEQKPLLSFQSHLSYQFKPGIWLAVSAGRTTLGETVLNGTEKNDNQNNTRTGVAFAYRLNKNNSLKIAATMGVTTRYGSDYTTVLIAYQYLWFDKQKTN